MGSHATADETIWPTQNDIALTVGNGSKLLENQWTKPFAVLNPNSYALSGLTVPGTSASLNINVALGTAFIAGRHITIPGATAVTAAASSTNYVFLKLTRDGSNLVTGASFEVNITNVPPTDSIAIAILVAGASTITSTTDLRTIPTRIQSLTSGTTWTCPAGIYRIYVEVLGASGGGGGGEGVGDGGTGGDGGTTAFGSFSVTGGIGGFGGGVNDVGGSNHGVGSGAPISRVGGGQVGGHGGRGNATLEEGQDGGHGGYSAGWIDTTPNVDITYAIGAAGAAGTANGTGSRPGTAGQAGLIVIRY